MKIVRSLALLTTYAAAVWLTACATPPAAEAPRLAASDCAALDAARASAEADQRRADEAVRDAWKVVIPFAIAARYAKAETDAEEAALRGAAIDAERKAQGCRHG